MPPRDNMCPEQPSDPFVDALLTAEQSVRLEIFNKIGEVPKVSAPAGYRGSDLGAAIRCADEWAAWILDGTVPTAAS